MYFMFKIKIGIWEKIQQRLTSDNPYYCELGDMYLGLDVVQQFLRLVHVHDVKVEQELFHELGGGRRLVAVVAQLRWTVTVHQTNSKENNY